jgi:DNA-binding NtrC family response regulator
LKKRGFDLLSDYLLPSFDGLLALKIRQEISSELSFILVSGMLGEEVAIESLMSGATDYVKNRLERLIPAVCCAIQEAEERTKRRRAEEERERLLIRERAARERVSSLLEGSSDAFFAVDADWRFTYINQCAGR